jgi:hypothetical protein
MVNVNLVMKMIEQAIYKVLSVNDVLMRHSFFE